MAALLRREIAPIEPTEEGDVGVSRATGGNLAKVWTSRAPVATAGAGEMAGLRSLSVIV